jgi:hypothetical protein
MKRIVHIVHSGASAHFFDFIVLSPHLQCPAPLHIPSNHRMHSLSRVLMGCDLRGSLTVLPSEQRFVGFFGRAIFEGVFFSRGPRDGKSTG